MKKRGSKPKLGTMPSKAFETTLPPGWKGAQMTGVRSIDFLNPREAAAARRAKREAGPMRRQLAAQLHEPKGGWGAGVDDMLRKKQRFANLLEHAAVVCTVEGCGAQVGAGGRKSAPAKCARCYQRERRGQVEAPRGAGELRDQKLTISFTAHGRALLERQAASAGVSVSVFLERLVLGEPSGVAVDG